MSRAMSEELDRSELMRRVRSADTAPEQLLRKALWAQGIRYRTCRSDLPGKPDIVVAKHRLAIFVDGDFWHGNQWRRRGLKSLSQQFSGCANAGYWKRKIQRNMLRDAATTAALASDGWTVIRFWESQVMSDVEACVSRVVATIRQRRLPKGLGLLAAKTSAEFFAGIGLMRMALERQGWTVKYCNDIDAQKYEMYSGHFDDAHEHYVVGDVHEIDSGTVPTVTLATASFPCNDLSLAGGRAGLNGRQSGAFWGFLKVLSDMEERRPPLVLLENVTGFLTSHGGQDLASALGALNELGYLVDALILDAVDFVPQSRKRLFVVGVHRSVFLGPSSPVQSLPLCNSVRPQALCDFILRHPDINWRVRPLPMPEKRHTSLEDIIQDLPEDAPEWWSADRAAYLLNQMSPRHRDEAERMIARREWSYGTVFRRTRKGKSTAELRTDGVAGCLRTPRGGSARQILLKAGFGRYAVRFITPREAARLMGADDYRYEGPLNLGLFGFGDAVCVPVVEWIAENYLNPLVNELIRGFPLRGH